MTKHKVYDIDLLTNNQVRVLIDVVDLINRNDYSSIDDLTNDLINKKGHKKNTIVTFITNLRKIDINEFSNRIDNLVFLVDSMVEDYYRLKKFNEFVLSIVDSEKG